MAYRIKDKTALAKGGLPFIWGSGDQTTAPVAGLKSEAIDIVNGELVGDYAAGDQFGFSVAVGSGRIVVGSPYDDDNGTDSGSAYVFDLNGYNLIAKIKPTVNGVSDGAAYDQFGYSVAVGSGRIVVGSCLDEDNGTDSGSAYVFDLNGNPIAKIKPTVNGVNDGAASDYFGWSVAVGSGRIVVGSQYDDDNGTNSGSAYVFDLNGNPIAKIKPTVNGVNDGAANDYFGYSVAVGSGRIVVGARGDDDNGSDSGSAYIFDLNGNEIAKIKPTVNGVNDGAAGDEFGRSVAVGSGRIVVGSYLDDDNGTNSGSAYVFDLNGNPIAKIKPTVNGVSDGAAYDYFGYSVAVGSGRIVVGSPLDDDNGINSGSAYVFDLNGNEIAKIKAYDAQGSDNFGFSVAVGSGRIVVGSPFDDGILDQYSNAGAAYIFNTPEVYTPFDAADLNT